MRWEGKLVKTRSYERFHLSLLRVLRRVLSFPPSNWLSKYVINISGTLSCGNSLQQVGALLSSIPASHAAVWWIAFHDKDFYRYFSHRHIQALEYYINSTRISKTEFAEFYNDHFERLFINYSTSARWV